MIADHGKLIDSFDRIRFALHLFVSGLLLQAITPNLAWTGGAALVLSAVSGVAGAGHTLTQARSATRRVPRLAGYGEHP